ncbi:unnamed protein product [Lepeophtheirus salmonis]|uniref:Elongator complex protein 6 n=1 Tax=Lepeophtheirus salmonis TaxID=72036 RepID=A0A7R8GZW6_LEPSM|nr:unnamed protein product [Lepeophtheirus salmonis]CAF2772760.1 unnamed protein product [Lepeophtheirus salmonis]
MTSVLRVFHRHFMRGKKGGSERKKREREGHSPGPCIHYANPHLKDSRTSVILGNAMFTEFHSTLRWDQFSWNNGGTVVVLEESGADASFVIHHLLSMVSKQSDLSAVLVSLKQTKGHYQAVSLRIGGNLMKHLESEGNELNFIKSGNLSGLYERIEKESQPSCLILIDKLAILQDLGVSKGEIITFFNKLRELAKKLSGTLVIITSEDSGVGKFMGHCSDYILKVSPLETGYSSSVTGNLRFRWGKYEQDKIQYLRRDKFVQVFALGSSSAVL